MPYRIKARSNSGNTVTMMDLDATHKPITDRKYAEQLAEEFASTRTHGGPWRPIVEYYKDSIANPLWDRNGAVRNPYDKKK
jgi:inosine-uridine nucleoside N-ribohydrolase